MSNALGQMSQLSIFQAHYSLITNQFSVFIRTSLLASHLHRHATMAQNSRADSLERRLVQFAIDIVTLVGQLVRAAFRCPRFAVQTPAGNHRLPYSCTTWISVSAALQKLR